MAPWTYENRNYAKCLNCMKTLHVTRYGTLRRRKYVDEGGAIVGEYQIVCRLCDAHTEIHRSKLLTEKEWEGMQDIDFRPISKRKNKERLALQTSP